MLRPAEYEHLTPNDWEIIARKLLKLKDGQQLIMFSSDEHEGGTTSFMPQVGKVLEGFGRCAAVWVKNGDNYEYETPMELKTAVKKGGGNGALQEIAADILRRKISEDIAGLERQIRENPNRQIVKIIGNHENCTLFREELRKLEDKYPNFQWSPELELIRVPGAKKKKSDFILAFHGDLQVDDMGIVEDGYTDRQRPVFSLEEMAAKAVQLATKYFSPSAERQEDFQWLVSWWRKPKPTAKTILAELRFAAQNADLLHLQRRNMKKVDAELDHLDETKELLKARRDKFKEFRKELRKEEMGADEKEAAARELAAYDATIENLDDQIHQVRDQIRAVKDVSHNVQSKFHIYQTVEAEAKKKVLHYKRPGRKEPRLFTFKIFERVTHMNYGHTHVPCEGIEIEDITVSNNGSVTLSPMQAQQDEEKASGDWRAGEAKVPDLRNLGALLYKTEEGRVKDIISIGRLLREKKHAFEALVRAIPKSRTEPELPDSSLARPENVRHLNGGGGISTPN